MNIRYLNIWGEETKEVAKILVGKGYSDAYIEAVMWAGRNNDSVHDITQAVQQARQTSV